MKRMYGYIALIICVVFITFSALGLAMFANLSAMVKIGILIIVVILFVIVGIVFDIFSKPVKRSKY